MLVEIDGCIFDERQITLSHGYEKYDKVDREVFVNHIHLNGENRVPISQEIIAAWSREMKEKWPGQVFRIYRQVNEDEITLRFHLVRKGEPDWCDSGLDIIEVKT